MSSSEKQRNVLSMQAFETLLFSSTGLSTINPSNYLSTGQPQATWHFNTLINRLLTHPPIDNPHTLLSTIYIFPISYPHTFLSTIHTPSYQLSAHPPINYPHTLPSTIRTPSYKRYPHTLLSTIYTTSILSSTQPAFNH